MTLLERTAPHPGARPLAPTTARPATVPGLAGPAVPLAATLARHGERIAVRCEDGTAVTHRDLARRVDDAAARLGTTRRLVLVEGANDLATLVAYLGALAGGHPVLLVPAGPHVGALVAAYDPDVVATPHEPDRPYLERRRGTAHQLHPDLALLLTTSGSTGTPKLVRLSHRNVEANAASIARFLGIRPTDLAATTLPLAYSYGLSVVHSHLRTGAGLLLTGSSVVDPCFWERFAREGATTFAGVPHTFSLLDRAGFEDLDLPSLRYVTQAGGRLAPDRVRHLAALGRRRGWRFVVMYGQTEATARMAYLPPDLAESHPDCIGVPIPGGSFHLDEGELVYRGPNVMLGYATGPDDLALGATVAELRTGDLARRDDRTGLYRIVGRRSRFVKPFGLRIDLDRAEALLAEAGVEALCAGDDEHVAVGVRRPADPNAASALLARRLGLPPGAVRAVALDELPVLPSGKPDRVAVARAVAADAPSEDAPSTDAPSTDGRSEDGSDRVGALAAAYAEVLGRDGVGGTDSFVSLGGDSLSYVEASVRVEAILGRLPDGWHVTPIEALADGVPDGGRPRARRRLLRPMDTGLVLRAAAIVAVVLAHLELVGLQGGAHVLLAVAGYNLARFQLAPGRPDEGSPGRRLGASAWRVAAPALAWIGLQLVVDDRHALANLALANNYLADGTWRYWYWFVEVLVQLLVLVGLVLSVPAVARLERRAPFAFAAGLLAVALAASAVPFGAPENDLFRTHAVAWVFLLGWAAQRADTVARRALVTAVAAFAVPVAFGSSGRDLVVLAGLALVVWAPALPVPAPLHRPVAVLASASLAIYLTHWAVLHHLWGRTPAEVTAVVALVVGVAAHRLGRRAVPVLRAAGRHLPPLGLSVAGRVPVPWGASKRVPSGGWPAT